MSSVEHLVLGVGKAVINPPEGVLLMGYPNIRANTGVGLDLTLRLMIFGAPESQAALVVLDNLGLEPAVIVRLKTTVAEAVHGLEPAQVMVAATHTHSAPSLSTYRSKETDSLQAPDTSYVDLVCQACRSAARDALASQQTVSLRVGMSKAFLGHNRRVVDSEGRAVNEWHDPDGTHTGYFNPVINYAAFASTTSDKVCAIICGYGCHPVTLGPENVMCHSDYPGYLVRRLEKETGAGLAIHITTGGANINPKGGLKKIDERAREVGEEIADRVCEDLPHAKQILSQPVKSACVELEYPMSAEATERIRARAADGTNVQTRVQAIRIGDLAMVSAPGELFAEIATSVENLSPARHTFVVGYGNDYLGYIFTDTARREGGYEPKAPFSDSVEAQYIAAARNVLGQVMAD